MNALQEQVSELRVRVEGLEKVNIELMRRVKWLEKSQVSEQNPFPVEVNKFNFHKLNIAAQTGK